MASALLKFGKGNAKLGDSIFTFSLPSGFTCPTAHLCLSKADKETGKITDGPHTQFRCFTASAESKYPTLRAMVWHNFGLLKTANTREAMTDLIHRSLATLPKKFTTMRVHVSGDYYNENYFLAWREAAKLNPDKKFYSYTKRADLLVKHGQVDGNHSCVASFGGTMDHLIEQHGLVSARVVFSYEEAKEKNLEIDHDDSHAIDCSRSFALLLHGTQPKGSQAAKALSALRKTGWEGYSTKKKTESKEEITDGV